MPHIHKDIKVVFGESNKPKLDEDVIGRHNDAYPGSGDYWRNLMTFDEMNRRSQQHQTILLVNRGPHSLDETAEKRYLQ